jgi:hypothetical protein
MPLGSVWNLRCTPACVADPPHGQKLGLLRERRCYLGKREEGGRTSGSKDCPASSSLEVISRK